MASFPLPPSPVLHRSNMDEIRIRQRNGNDKLPSADRGSGLFDPKSAALPIPPTVEINGTAVDRDVVNALLRQNFRPASPCIASQSSRPESPTLPPSSLPTRAESLRGNQSLHGGSPRMNHKSNLQGGLHSPKSRSGLPNSATPAIQAAGMVTGSEGFVYNPTDSRHSRDNSLSSGEKERDYPRTNGESMPDLTTTWAPLLDPRITSRFDRATPHLPELTADVRDTPTSYPISVIQRELDYSLRKLLTENVFTLFLEEPICRHRFREYLEAEGRSGGVLLDAYWDSVVLNRAVDHVKAGGKAYHDVYIALDDQRAKLSLHPDTRQDALMHMSRLATLDSPLVGIQNALLHRLYHQEFQAFVKHKLVEEARVRLGRSHLIDSGLNGLGDCFVLTNPRLRDHPIVLVSDGFTELTGYARQPIIGRNCRFLQGPGTSFDAVARIRTALNNGLPVTELLVNYRKNGEPFYNLLQVLPLYSSDSQLAYFIGGQTNVNGLIKTSKNLSFLIGVEPADEGTHFTLGDSPTHLSPTMESHLRHSAAAQKATSTRQHTAAGFVSAVHTSSAVQAFNDLMNPMAESAPSTGGKLKNLVGKFTQQAPSQELSNVTTTRAAGNGHLNLNTGFAVGNNSLNPVGMDAKMAKQAPLSVDAWSEAFTDVYTKKVIVFEPVRSRIVYCSEGVLAYLGLPMAKSKDIHDNLLLHKDVTDIVHSPDGEAQVTAQIRQNMKAAIRGGNAFSVAVEMKVVTKNMLHRAKTRGFATGMLHATPLKDRDGCVTAFVALYGSN